MFKIISFADFLAEHREDIFAFWVYRRIYTPYEQQQAFTDESLFEDNGAVYAKITECASIGDHDFLLGMQIVIDPDCDEIQLCDKTEYYRLSEIRLKLHKTNRQEE